MPIEVHLVVLSLINHLQGFHMQCVKSDPIVTGFTDRLNASKYMYVRIYMHSNFPKNLQFSSPDKTTNV